MSLMLRKMTQEILDDAGLESFHTQINEQKRLTIVGECGQELVNINGIAFSKFTLTAAERKFATELLGDFLVKHHSQLLEFLKKSRAFKAKPEPKRKGKNWYTHCGKFQIFDDILQIRVDATGVIKRIENTSNFSNSNTTITQFCHYSINSKMAQQALKEIKAYQKWVDEQIAISDLQAKLSMCEI